MVKVSIQFVEEKKYDASSVMSVAFEESKSKYNLQPKWISADDCCKLKRTNLRKTDVFVFENFNGPAFEFLSASKALVVGTHCLLKCLSQKMELPSSKHPLFSLILSGFIITTSGLKLEQREKIQTYVQWMGGVFDPELHVKTTHLISNNVTSVKYHKAVEKLIPILSSKWAEAVWNECLADMTFGDCSEFIQDSLNEYRLSPFHGLTITSASLKPAERDRVKTNVEENGGNYMGTYRSNLTDVVVSDESGVNSAKYRAAIESKKQIVKPSWIYASVAAGYALPMDGHRVHVVKISTPEKDNINADLTSNFSMMSVIVSDKHSASVIDETVRIPEKTINEIPAQITNSTSKKATCEIKSLFDMKTVRNAGLFLDGCYIYIAGFSEKDEKFLYKILYSGGAVVCEELSDRVSHVILADTNFRLPTNYIKAPIVNINWLIECIQNEQVVPEEKFLMQCIKNIPSVSKRKLHYESVNISFSPRSERLEDIENQTKLLKLYNSANSCSKTMNSTDFTESTSKFTFLADRIFYISECISSSIKQELQMIIVDAGGEITKQCDNANYMILPELIDEIVIKPESCQIVSPLFINCCLEQQAEVTIEYYHNPIIISEIKPLKGLVFSISSYPRMERRFISELIKELGALYTDSFLRVSNPELGLEKATHLICKEAKGEKYNACLLWGLPAVNVQWLLKCYETRTRILETEYLVGETNTPERTSILDESKQQITITGVDVEHSTENNETILSENKTSLNAFYNDQNCNQSTTLKSPDEEDTMQEKSIQSLENCNLPELSNEEANNDEDLESTLFIELDSNEEVFNDEFEEQRKIFSKRLGNLDRTKLCFSQATPPPVRKILQRIQGGIGENPESPELPPLPDFMKTPSTPYGAFIFEDPTPETRKRWKRWCESLPTPASPITPKSPPLSWSDVQCELKTLLMMGENEARTVARKLTFEDKDQDFYSMDKENLVDNGQLLESKTLGPFRRRPPVFLFSGVSNQIAYIKKILDLGGRICEAYSNEYDDCCSHILCDMPTKSEKILAGMSSGKWILSTSYIDQCFAEKRFIEEEEFEWGNPKSHYKCNNNEIALANYIWRCKLNNSGNKDEKIGAFRDWKVVLWLNKKDFFRKIISAGSGSIVECDNLKLLEEGSVSHCFCEPHNILINADEIRHLTKIGAYMLPVEYLFKYLIDDITPDPKRFLISV